MKKTVKNEKWDFVLGQYILHSSACGDIIDSNCVPIIYGHEYFFTRYPLETTKFWNLVYLFTPEAWMWTFISILTIILVLYLARILSEKLGLSGDSTEEIILFPFRFLKLNKYISPF